MNVGKVNKYGLRTGMVIERKYRNQSHRLLITEEGGKLRFKTAGKTFLSLTAAAKFVIGTDTEISGARFWGVRAPKR